MLDEPSWSIPYSKGGQNMIMDPDHDAPQYGFQNPETKRLNLAAQELYEQEKKRKGGRTEKEIIQSGPGARSVYDNSTVCTPKP